MQDSQSYRTGQSLGPYAVDLIRDGIKPGSACETELYGYVDFNPMPSNVQAFLQGCTDYVHQHGY